MARIIVTGGSGFIGTNVIQFFLDKGFEILNIDVKTPQNIMCKKYWTSININDYDKLNKIVAAFLSDYILHLAARTDFKGKDINDYSSNILGVENILKVSKAVPSLKKIIITSSMLVCKGGYIPKGPFDYYPNTLIWD